MVDLLVPGRCHGSGEFSLAADLGLVAVLELGRAEFSLAVDLSWVAGPATRDAEFSLVEILIQAASLYADEAVAV